MLKKLLKIPCALSLIISCAMASCSSNQLEVSRVVYQSVRMQTAVEDEIPQNAKIVVAYRITEDGAIIPIVFNQTDEIMIIDQTKSFFVNSNGVSTSYYDPTVRTTSTTDLSSNTGGASLNLGAVGNALGIGGPMGSLLNGINVGGSSTSGQATTKTTYFSDQPQVALAPRSNGAMSKTFLISALQIDNVQQSYIATKPTASYGKFSVCISYSINDGKTFEKIVTDFYINAQIVEQVTQKGKVNDALRRVYSAKADALYENWWLLRFANNLPYSLSFLTEDNRCNIGYFYDYK